MIIYWLIKRIRRWREERRARRTAAEPPMPGRRPAPRARIETPFDGGAAISVRGLTKTYAGREALRGIDFDVRHGEIVAFLGPNGAGKTTTVEILEGYRERTGGEVQVLGEDPAAGTRAWRDSIGVVLQDSQPEPYEPTTGFDPSARRSAWQVVAGLRELGKTIFLTTHYMDEAEFLADRILVLAGGEIVAEGTPATLGGRDRSAARITFTLPDAVRAEQLPAPFGAAAVGTRVEARSSSPIADLRTLSAWAGCATLSRGSSRCCCRSSSSSSSRR